MIWCKRNLARAQLSCTSIWFCLRSLPQLQSFYSWGGLVGLRRPHSCDWCWPLTSRWSTSSFHGLSSSCRLGHVLSCGRTAFQEWQLKLQGLCLNFSHYFHYILLVRASPKASRIQGAGKRLVNGRRIQITLKRGVRTRTGEIVAVSFTNNVSQALVGHQISPEASRSPLRRKWQSIAAAHFSVNVAATGQQDNFAFPNEAK